MIQKVSLVVLAIAMALQSLYSQTNEACLPPDETSYEGEVLFNYGSSDNAISTIYSTNGTIGQPLVGTGIMLNQPKYQSTTGFWSQFLVPPLAPVISASQGEYLDRIQVEWEPNPLGALPTLGFKLFRDGVFQAQLDRNTRNYNDYNVIAGVPYIYSVRGINDYGDGVSEEALGFQVPNGTVTGWVQTLTGSSVPDVLVSLSPLQGYSLQLGVLDGAVAVLDGGTFLPDSALNDYNDYTITFWILNQAANHGGKILEMEGYPLNMRSRDLSGDRGIDVYFGDILLFGADYPEAGSLLDTTWYNIALSYSRGTGRLYINGELLGSGPINQPPTTSSKLYLGNQLMVSSGWGGNIDELRIYHRRLNEIDLREVMVGTASSTTSNLKYYWKMDEQLGTKSFDIINRSRLFFCGGQFSSKIPPVAISARTTEQGYYIIESASYGTGTTFKAIPRKQFYKYRSLLFSNDQKSFAVLPDFSLPSKTTIEMWVYSDGPEELGQCLLSKKWGANSLEIALKKSSPVESDLIFNLNGNPNNVVGSIGTGYHHLAFTVDSMPFNWEVGTYIDGVLTSTNNFPTVSGNWSDSTTYWIIGAKRAADNAASWSDESNYTDFFNGLMDEFAAYEGILAPDSILLHALKSRDMASPGLRIYFPMDEGDGDRLNNCGSYPLDSFGIVYNTAWNTFTKFQSTEPHLFTPASRQVTLNPSVTSVDQVDFTDRSTISVTGYVRYANTDCFASNVEILVNGTSYLPKVFTDSTGKFSIDFEPGKTAVLSPSFEDHVFLPKFWNIENITTPVAGIVFSDITTRKVEVNVTGGTCGTSTLGDFKGVLKESYTVQLRSASNDCFERYYEVFYDNSDGGKKIVIDKLPPLAKMTVGISNHSDIDVLNALMASGGVEVDISKRDTILSFNYRSAPEIELLEGFTNIACGELLLTKGVNETVTFGIREVYNGGRCYLDTAALRISNGFADLLLDTTLSKAVPTAQNPNPISKFVYQFRAGDPNPVAPYHKTFQIVGTTVEGQNASYSTTGIVQGLRNNGVRFTSVMPQVPTMILRDPPGDQSYSYFAKDSSSCSVVKVDGETELGFGLQIDWDNAPDTWTIAAPLGVGVITPVEATLGVSVNNEIKFKFVNNSTFEACLTMGSTISTSSDELIVGGEQGGDVYVGMALNLVFGTADKIEYNDTTCTVEKSSIATVAPGGATAYRYSEYYIKRYLRPYLTFLASDYQQKANSATGVLQAALLDSVKLCNDSEKAWELITERNAALKQLAKFQQNLSFDAGVTQEYTSSSSEYDAYEFSDYTSFESSANFLFGLEVLGVGFNATVKTIANGSYGGAEGSSTGSSITTGYVLADNDPGDAYTVDIAMDSVYRTPVFNVKSGQSSCPWEEKTAARDAVNLEPIAGFPLTAINIPSKEPAVFRFSLGNVSQTYETRHYKLFASPEDNPYGASIKLNGDILNNDTDFEVYSGQSLPVTITVERGPIEYDYSNLRLKYYASCENDRASDLGLDPSTTNPFTTTNPLAYSTQLISAHFVRPCSEVDIYRPQSNYVILSNDPSLGGSNATSTVRDIIINNYNTIDSNFQLVRVQYRRADGNGIWINITSPVQTPVFSSPHERWNTGHPDYQSWDIATMGALPAPLDPISTVFKWETDGLADGPYEIRAITVCTGPAAGVEGSSYIIPLRIDRSPPSIVSWEPSDGVFEPGDEISFTFDKVINTDKFTPPSGNPYGKIDLYDTSTGGLIDATVTAFENKIFLVPNIQNEFIENKVLRVELKQLEDMVGNNTGSYPMEFMNKVPEFIVNRNELAWLTDSIGMTKRLEQTKTITASIQNKGAYSVPFEIQDTPEWVRVVPNQGTLAANEVRAISFTADSSLAFGMWRDSVKLKTLAASVPIGTFMGGEEFVPLGVRVVCSPPAWDLNPGLYENSMNMVLRLNVEGNISGDVEDMVGAFIEGTLRGRSNIQFVPHLSSSSNKVYLAYLTIYGGATDVLKPITLQIWDASACLLYGTVEESFQFTPDQVIGTPTSPQTATTNSLLFRELPFREGWNWLSFNLAFSNNGLNQALSSLSHPSNDLIKSQSQLAFYGGGMWVGSLTHLVSPKMYQFKADQADTLRILGMAIPHNLPVPVTTGWNWIGYIPNYSLEINEALSSLEDNNYVSAGDLIKSQSSFAQYITTPLYTGWIGNLNYMVPMQGYQINLKKQGVSGQLVYPASSQRSASGKAQRGSKLTFWEVNPTEFENSATLIGMLKIDGNNQTDSLMELGAFVGEEVRGVAEAIYAEPLGAYFFFLTYYSNQSGETVYFKLFNEQSGQVLQLNESLSFLPDQHQGTLESPFPFTLGVVTAMPGFVLGNTFSIHPNPFREGTTFRFISDRADHVQFKIIELNGREVFHKRIWVSQGVNTYYWSASDNGGSALPPGVYLVQVTSDLGTVTRKLVLQK